MSTHTRFIASLLSLLGYISVQSAYATEPSAINHYDNTCINEALQHASGDVTLKELRESCLVKNTVETKISPIEKRIQADQLNQYNPFSIQTYRPNYLLLGSYNFAGTNEKPYASSYSGNDFFEPIEAKFQISLKIPVAENLLNWGEHWFVAYTNRSFWQSYNSHISSPFRETNHEPEAWVSFDNDWKISGWKNRQIDVGLVHQSNGQSNTLSRSWNRVYLRFSFEKENSVIIFKPWLRVPESANDDDNPDISHYMGDAELTYLTKYTDHNFRIKLRNNLDAADNKGAIEVGYTYPINRNVNFYTQWFYGYGESLIDYNYRNNTLGIGVQFGNLF